MPSAELQEIVVIRCKAFIEKEIEILGERSTTLSSIMSKTSLTLEVYAVLICGSTDLK